MSDNKLKTGKADRIRINFNEHYELDYWTNKWKISARQLHGAHKATGSVLVSKIEKYLKEKALFERL